MLSAVVFLFGFFMVNSNHFNGGTIRWAPVNPSDNGSSIAIQIVQTYFWSYPLIKCDINVPISTPGRSGQSSNLTCVVDCSTDGGYSTKPISILTDCISSAFAPSIMLAERTTNITLTSGAHFYLAYVGSSWTALGSPAQSGLEWSIVTMIDLRRRSDGLINTPPTASIVSPQYVIVNRTTQIRIQVSDSNIGDDVRCRWSSYSSGSRRRRDLYMEIDGADQYSVQQIRQPINQYDTVHIRNKRMHLCSQCSSTCKYKCQCNCSVCFGTNCTGSTCSLSAGCSSSITTTLDTPGTLRSTSTYPTRQAINECGDVCFPSSVPNTTTLANCTLSFRGLVPDTWYAVAIQVEDFINKSSTVPMSSIPVQVLIYVMPEPLCTQAPVILPIVGCQEASVGIPKIFNITVLNMCSSNDTDISDLIVSKRIAGMLTTNLSTSSSNASLSFITLTWIPQANQIGPQQMCLIAYTEERLQSDEYCVTFTVISSAVSCATTTTTSTTTTTTTTTTRTTTTSTTTTTTITTTATASTSNSISIATTTTITTTSSSSNYPTASVTSEKSPSWGLIAGICTAVFPLIFISVCCLYQLHWSPRAKRHLIQEEESDFRNSFPSLHSRRSVQDITETGHQSAFEMPNKGYRVYEIDSSGTVSRSNQSDMNIAQKSGLIYACRSDNANPSRSFSITGRASFLEIGEHSILSRLFADQKATRITSSSSMEGGKSDFSSETQVGNMTRANASSVLMSTFLAQNRSNTAVSMKNDRSD